MNLYFQTSRSQSQIGRCDELLDLHVVRLTGKWARPSDREPGHSSALGAKNENSVIVQVRQLHQKQYVS